VKWNIGSRSGTRTIVSRVGKILTVQCECGSPEHTISLSSFLQSPKCRECCKDESINPMPAGGGTPEYDAMPLMLDIASPTELNVVSLPDEDVFAQADRQGNGCKICLTEEPVDHYAVKDALGNHHLICGECRPLLVIPTGFLNRAIQFIRGTPWGP